MDLEKIKFSDKPLTLYEHIMAQRGSQNDYEAMLAFILSRTNMMEAEVLKLDDEDLLLLINRINVAVDQAKALQAFGRKLND
jgi:hypothetical protein